MKKIVNIRPHAPSTPHPGSFMSQDRLVYLIHQVAQKLDRQAFGELFDTLAPKVKSILIQRGLDAAAADDVMQEVMLNVWTKAGLYDESRGSPQGWVFTIARNASIDRARRRKPDISLDMIEWDPVDETESSEQRLMHNEQAAKLRLAMQTIPTEQLAVVQLAYGEELTQTEIAVKLGVPLGTVKSRLRLAYARLRGAMDERQ